MIGIPAGDALVAEQVLAGIGSRESLSLRQQACKILRIGREIRRGSKGFIVDQGDSFL